MRLPNFLQPTSKPRGLDGREDDYGLSLGRRAFVATTVSAVAGSAYWVLMNQAEESDRLADIKRQEDWQKYEQYVKKRNAELHPDEEQKVSAQGSTADVPEELYPDIWEQKGNIKKGTVLSVRAKCANGQEKKYNVVFKDEGRATIFVVNGRRFAQTADGFPLRVSSVSNENNCITVEGAVLLFATGRSKWTPETLSRLCLELDEKGFLDFHIEGDIKNAKGRIQLIEEEKESEVAAAEDGEGK